MKNSISVLLFMIIFSSCSSSEKVSKMSKEYEPVLEQDAQVQRVITMIKEDKDLKPDAKEELVELVEEQSKKITENRKKQSQLRAVLIDQLLQASDGSKSDVIATTKELEKLNKQNIKGMKDFVLKFQSLSGEKDIRQNDFMREVSNIHFL